MFEATDVIAIIISCYFFCRISFMYRISRENLSLNAFMKAIEIWGSNKVREARRYIRECFPDYSESEDSTGEKMELKIQNGEQIKRGYLKVRELSDEERDYFEKIAVTADRVGFMLFELKNLPRRFKRAYLKWLYDTFYSIWNKIAPHVNREREAKKCPPMAIYPISSNVLTAVIIVIGTIAFIVLKKRTAKGVAPPYNLRNQVINIKFH